MKKSKNEELLETLVSQQAEILKIKQESKTGILTLIDGIPYFIKLGAPIVGIFLWYQNNVPTMKQVNDNSLQIEMIKSSFASQSQYRDQQKQIDELREAVARGYNSLIDRIDKSNNELKEFSTNNRHWVESVLSEVKDANKTNVSDMKDYIKAVIDQSIRKR